MSSFGEELERLARLRANGDITYAEYETLKANFLSELSGEPGGPPTQPEQTAAIGKAASAIPRQSIKEAAEGLDQEATPSPKEFKEFPRGFTPVRSSSGSLSVPETIEITKFDRLLIMMTSAASANEVKTALQEHSDALMAGFKFSEEETLQLNKLRETLLKIHAINREKKRAELEENRRRHDAGRGSANAHVNPIDEATSFDENGTPHLDLNKIPTEVEPPLTPDQQQIANGIKEKLIASSDDPERARFLAEMPLEQRNALIEAFEKHVLGSPKRSS
jgi:hypothetical protein